MLADAHHTREANKWRHTRALAVLLINIHRDPKTPAVAESDWMQLPGDPPPTPAMDKEELEATLARLQ